ncbi:response regulator [Desulfonatronovibrio magnus]|uniref:response regulator n=1 Tax=Desulfonatronovibrio magnus TaxID=698827 RepID=UPI0005EAD5DD|nr:response regulator [Desulfonatronovibrio magnus]
MDVDPQHLISELSDNIDKKDTIKANIVLAYLNDTDKDTQKKIINLLEKGDPDFTIPLLTGLIQKNKSITTNLPDIRGILISKSLEQPDFLLKTIMDKVEPRELFINIAAEARVDGASAVLLNIMANELDEKVIKEAIIGLGTLGFPGATNAISEFLYSNNKTLILEAIRALGRIGTPTAMQRLAEKMGADHQIDILILDVFSQIQDQTSINKLNQTIGSHYAHLRNYAKAKLTRIGAKAVPTLGENLFYNDPDLQVHTLNVLGAIGDSSALVPIRKLLSQEPADANVRFAAYETLGQLPLDKGSYILARGLTDKEEHVCVAAASAIDRNLNEVLVAGVKNMVKERDHDALKTVRSIISAQAKNLFIALIEYPFFQDMALGYLTKNAAPDLQNFFQSLLQKYGYLHLAEKIEGEKPQAAARPVAVAVDDSKMILNIYKSTLYEMGFEPVLFEFPRKALDWLKNNKPQVVFTDLNMPDMTGIDLIQGIREIYSKNDLPVIMVTTQNETQDNEDARNAGVNDITFKPFSKESLTSVYQESSC